MAVSGTAIPGPDVAGSAGEVAQTKWQLVLLGGERKNFAPNPRGAPAGPFSIFPPLIFFFSVSPSWFCGGSFFFLFTANNGLPPPKLRWALRVLKANDSLYMPNCSCVVSCILKGMVELSDQVLH